MTVHDTRSYTPDELFAVRFLDVWRLEAKLAWPVLRGETDRVNHSTEFALVAPANSDCASKVSFRLSTRYPMATSSASRTNLG